MKLRPDSGLFFQNLHFKLILAERLHMKKYLILYKAPADAMAQNMNLSPEQQEKGMALWMQWMKNCGDHMVDPGMPLMPAKTFGGDGNDKPADLATAGYTILQGENMQQISLLMKDHPHTSGWNPKALIEIYETMILPGM